MIKNNSLSDRLNAFKEKKDPSKETLHPLTNTPVTVFISSILTTLIIIFKVFVFGFSTKIIFNTDWSIWSTLCIGVAINFLLAYIDDLVHN